MSLSLVCSPPAQLLEQADHFPHGVQAQFTPLKQICSLHVFTSFSNPSHGLPPYIGGISTLLDRADSPPLHVALHSLQDVQAES